MRHLILFLGLLLPFLTFAQEDIEFKKYSYSEFFQLIENEQSQQFSLKNAIVELDSLTDERFFTYINSEAGEIEFTSSQKDSLFIDKEVHLENVVFDFEDNTIVFLAHISFREKVSIINSSGDFLRSTFEERVNIHFDDQFENLQLQVDGERLYRGLFFNTSSFKDGIRLIPAEVQKQLPVQLGFTSCLIMRKTPPMRQNFNAFDLTYFGLDNNEFKDLNAVYLFGSGNRLFHITENNFNNAHLEINLADKNNDRVNIAENKTEHPVQFWLPENIQNAQIEWEQFSNGVISKEGFIDYEFENRAENNDYQNFLSNEYGKLIKAYTQKGRTENKQMYKQELQLLGILNDIYKKQHDTESANASYIALKDLETARLAYSYQTTPTFDTFFEWKVNQFLKIFSAYGTRPAKAITMSVYVVLAFALVYLFFPNYWDSHGKNRIMDRYRFFTKYMKQDSGMHEVYLEEKNQELMASEDFKSYMQESEKGIPKFFMATALPLYRWSVAGTRTFSWMLSKVDVLKGKWSDTDEAKKGGKSILLIGAFLIALLYDVFIKILNALMLSIKTFTTLGFGEIPIKGLPRYLAIIQGFIGWFMLTIFSVSLISQLLN